MGWSVGFDTTWRRDIGYGVPATCDHPGCGAAIHRGLSYVCGGDIYGGESGCGLFFCAEHGGGTLCERCEEGLGLPPFDPTPDTPEWIRHKLTDASWARWREAYPADVESLRRVLEQSGLEEPKGDS